VPSSTLVRVDRKGAETKVAESKGVLGGTRVSSSGSRIVAVKTNDGSRASDIWMFELPSGTATRITSSADSSWPMFSPDGKSVWFTRIGNNIRMYSLPIDRNTEPQRLFEDKVLAASWSPDGKWLAYLRDGQIFIRPIGDSKSGSVGPHPLSPSKFSQEDPEFSPDGRWIVYRSDESGNSDVYVQLFPAGEKHQISSNGGANPAWSRNGRELFYIEKRGDKYSMMAVDVSLTGEFRAGKPHLLFDASPYGGSIPLRSYDVTPDGQFVMSHRQQPPDEPITRLNVVLGWANELKRRVPSRQP
jgi:Tol biopolymer transport system component